MADTQEQEWWGIYNSAAHEWHTENQRSNFDAFIGKLIYYPGRSIAEAHLAMFTTLLDPEDAKKYTVRRFE